MSFLTSLFLVVFLIGPSIPKDLDPIALLQVIVEAVSEKQDMTLQRLDEQERKIQIQQTIIQHFQAELKEAKRMLPEIVNSNSATQMMLREHLEQKESQSPQCPPRTGEEDGNTTDNDTRTMISNCKEVLDNGGTESGVYTITPKGFSEGVKVYCDQMTDGGGWLVILERKRPAQVNFNRSFEEYATGFGDPNGELWIGNRVLHSVTGDDPFTLRVEATGIEGKDYGGSRLGIWETFSVGGEDTQFRLSVGGYSDSSSTLGDALTRQITSVNNMKFSTYDRDNDGLSHTDCSMEYGEGGWWYKLCYGTNPTAPLGDTNEQTKALWHYWNKGSDFSYQLISEIEFKIRP